MEEVTLATLSAGRSMDEITLAIRRVGGDEGGGER